MSTNETPEGFDPGKHLSTVNGGQYLEVKWRLVWFRTDHPDGIIETTMMEHENASAVFRATVEIPTNPVNGGGGSATGWGSESADDFRDYIEKAETKALGRALAALGYGTQFTDEFADAASGRIADSPIGGQSYGGKDGGKSTRATDKQIKFLYALAREHGIGDVDTWIEGKGGTPENLSRADASRMIEWLQNADKRADKPATAQASGTAPAPVSGDPSASQGHSAPEGDPYWVDRVITKAQWEAARERIKAEGWNREDVEAFVYSCGVLEREHLTNGHLVTLYDMLDAGEKPKQPVY